MNGSNTYEDASRDYERFEEEQIAQDRDVVQSETADIDKTHVWMLVEELIEQNVVTPVPESQVLVHEPSGNAFRSEKALALFHKGWTAGSKAAVDKQVIDQ